MRVSAQAAFAVLMLVTASPGCGEQDINVATAVAIHDGGPAFESGIGHTCTSNASCLAEAYCAKSSCNAATGECKVRPLQCDNSTQVVCGCDGINYWNDCLRRADGIASTSANQSCENPTPCDGPDDMPCSQPNALCSKIAPGSGPNQCMAPSIGFCWVLPQSCPTDAGPPTWQSCGPGPSRCVDTCTAILSGEPYESAPPMCP